MEDLIYTAKIVVPNFDNLDTGTQFKILHRLEPKLTPEDMVIHYEAKYHYFNMEEHHWGNYIKYYL